MSAERYLTGMEMGIILQVPKVLKCPMYVAPNMIRTCFNSTETICVFKHFDAISEDVACWWQYSIGVTGGREVMATLAVLLRWIQASSTAALVRQVDRKFRTPISSSKEHSHGPGSLSTRCLK